MSTNGDIRTIRVLEFLHAYEKQESLWNPTLESYKNKAARDEAYMRIINDLNMPSLTIHDVKLKVKSIRTTYTKELRLLIKNKEEGKSYTPKLFWFNRAHVFLRNVSLSRDKKISFSSNNVSSDKTCEVNNNANDLPKQRIESIETISNIETTSLNSYDYKGVQGVSIERNITNSESLEDKGQVIEITSHEKNQITAESLHPGIVNQKFNEDPLADASETSSNMLNTVHHIDSNNIISTNTVDDEFDIFCRSVAAQLRGINDNYSRSVAKLKIQQILFEAETGHYRNNPCITIPVNQNISDL